MKTKFKEFKQLSDDITDIKPELDNYEKVKEVEVIQITGILSDEEVSKLDEAMVIHAGDFSNKEIKRGDYIYLSCLLKKPGNSYSVQNQGVIQCRVSDIFFGLSKLNSLMK